MGKSRQFDTAISHFFLHLLPFARLCGLFVGGLIFSLRAGTHHAETKVAARDRRVAVVTESNTTVRSVVVPASTAKDAVRPRRRTDRIRLRTGRVNPIPVPAPFQYISAHVVKSQLIRGFCLDIVGRTSAVVVIPRHISQTVASAVGVAVALFSSSCCVFSFSFRWQPIAVRIEVARPCPSALRVAWGESFLSAQCVAILNGIEPCHLVHRSAVTFAIACVCSHHITVLLLLSF